MNQAEEFQTIYSFLKSKLTERRGKGGEREHIEEGTDSNKWNSKDESQNEEIWFHELELMYTQEL